MDIRGCYLLEAVNPLLSPQRKKKKEKRKKETRKVWKCGVMCTMAPLVLSVKNNSTVCFQVAVRKRKINRSLGL